MHSIGWPGGLVAALLVITVFNHYPAGASLPAGSQPAAGLSDRVVLEGRGGEHTFVVTLVKRQFDRDKHKTRIGYGGVVYVDGRRAHGPLGQPPREELSLFRVSVDGERWNVSHRLWRDCYEPNLGKGAGPPPIPVYTQASLSPDGTLLVVEMLGSDGGGSYRVRWFLRRDGTHRRRIDDLG